MNTGKTISKITGLYRTKYYKSYGLKLPDALIAATAKNNNAILLINNIRHFSLNDILAAIHYLS
ncbi:MAG: hypothetical protein ACYDIA_03095 [Candidatus Humimicrobiaceae bacterium]